jgi:hypothetical protein
LVKTCRACKFHAKQIYTLAQMLQNDPTFMALRCVGAGHRGAVSLHHRRVSVSLCHYQQVYQVAKSDPCGQNQQAICHEIYQVHRLPNRIITDNGSQFTSGAFQGYCEDLGIQICYVSIAHPESNGQVERANAKILKGLKTHTYDGFKKHGKKWIDDLPCALWGNRTSPSQATGETPFFMVYGLRPSSPRRSPWALSMSRCTMKPRRTSFGVKISTWLMSEDGNLLLKMHGTGRHFSATTNSLCAAESSNWKIWCSDGPLAGKVPTSSPPPTGRVPFG